MEPHREFKSYFSDENVIERIISIKMSAVDCRREAERKHEVSKTSKKPSADSAVDALLPSRSRWRSKRPRHRHGRDRSAIIEIALRNAVYAGLECTPEPVDSYVPALGEVCSRLRARVFGNSPFSVSAPAVEPQRKRAGEDRFRAITKFSLEDRLVDGCVGAYLRDLFDPLFLDTAYSFRSSSGPRKGATNKTVFSDLTAFRDRHGAHGLYVAEADICGFYDCIDHSVLKAAFERACEKLRQTGVEIDARAVTIFHAFIDAFSFERDVLCRAQHALRRRHPDAEFPWPVEALRELHGHGSLSKIGVAQGSSISTVISNLIMDLADRAVMKVTDCGAAALFYARYCDDVIIVSPDRDLCTSANSAYCVALQQLKLPMHTPKRIITAADAANAKSKQTYLWDAPPRGGVVQWIRFVGFELRFDGWAKISRVSVRKHLDRIRAEIDALLKAVCPKGSKIRHPSEFEPLRKSVIQISCSAHARISGMSTGSVRQRDGDRRRASRCWLAGFSGIDWNPALEFQLRALDRHRRRQEKRIMSKLKFAPRIANGGNSLETRGFARAPSYVSHFKPS